MLHRLGLCCVKEFAEEIKLSSNKTQGRFEKFRYPLAIILSTVVLIVWYTWVSPPPNPSSPEPTRIVEQEDPSSSQELVLQEETLNVKPAQQDESLAAETQTEKLPVPVAVAESKEAEAKKSSSVPKDTREQLVVLKNDVLSLTISSKDAIVQEAIVLNRTNENGPIKSSLNLEQESLSGYGTGKIFFKEITSLDETLDMRFFEITEQSSHSVSMRYVFQGRQGKVFLIKQYILGQLYDLQLKISFVNEAGEALSIPYYILNGSNIGISQENKGGFDIKRLSYNTEDDNETVLGSIFFSSDEVYDETTEKNDWIAVDNRFYGRILAGVKADIQKTIFLKKAYINKFGTEDFYFSAAYFVKGAKDVFNIFYLPKNRDILNGYFDRDKQYYFNILHQFRIMRVLSSLMYSLIEYINGITRNYGISILILTVLIKLVTFPLTLKGMKSMHKMQLLSPKMQGIREKYKSSPQRLNTEMMGLYKKEGVSPLGGCLPLFIPLPFFIALYSLFQNMVELREIPFMWITDLTLPDTVYVLSYSIPFLGDQLNLLPVIMTITAFMQALMPGTSPAPAGGMNSAQAKQMKFMKYFFPIMFFFICWRLPSALVFFWTIQNIFSFFQNLMVRKMLQVKKT